jgi:predicted metal-dependent HD superfamily phosphohydrolase
MLKIDLLSHQFSEAFWVNSSAKFAWLVERYNEPHRHYHTLEHIQAMVDFLLKRVEVVSDQKSVMQATFYHDVIYDTKNNDNEERSAALLATEFPSLSWIEVPKQLILDTKKHVPSPNLVDADIFLDADLAILWRKSWIYREYSANIRKEYIWVPEDTYKEWRIKVLRSFLERKKLYFTEPVAWEFEERARRNIEAEIKELTQ